MTKRRSVFYKICKHVTTFSFFTAFVLSILLVKTRQDMIFFGRKMTELEKSIASFSTKNSELDAEILRLSSHERFAEKILSENLVRVNKSKVVRLTSLETKVYAMNKRNGIDKNRSAMENAQNQRKYRQLGQLVNTR